MKHKLLIAVAGGLLAVMWTHAVSADTLTIVITNVQSSTGTVMVQVLASEEQFKGEGQVAAFAEAAVEGEMRFQTANLPKGEYAFRVMHDENDNGRLDSNFVGMPKEPWAFSNNAMGNFGPPGWDDVRFTLDNNAAITIDLNQ